MVAVKLRISKVISLLISKLLLAKISGVNMALRETRDRILPSHVEYGAVELKAVREVGSYNHEYNMRWEHSNYDPALGYTYENY